MTTQNLSTLRLAIFAAPAFITSLLYGPMVGILPTIYAKYFGLDLALIGTVLLVSRLFDAVSDPVIGHLSDHTNTRIGRRKPWMLVGYSLTLIALYALFVPPQPVTAAYFMVSFLFFYLFMTMAEIPYAAWQVELSHDYQQRTRIITFRSISMNLGGVAFAALPFLPLFPTTEFTPEVFRVVAWGAICLLPPLVIMVVLWVPRGQELAVKDTDSIADLLPSLAQNKPFLRLISAYILFGLASGFYAASGFMFFDTYLLIGDKYPAMMMAGLITGVLTLPAWSMLMNRYGRHKVWAIGSILGACLFPFLLLFEPGTQAILAITLLWMLIIAVFVSGTVAPMAMLGDTVDYDTLKTGVNRSARYFAILTLAIKSVAAIGSGLGFFILKLFSYDASATTHDASSVFGLRLVLIWIPVCILIAAAAVLWRYPIDQERHQIIKRRIESLAERAAR